MVTVNFNIMQLSRTCKGLEWCGMFAALVTETDNWTGKLDRISNNCWNRTEGSGTCPKELITHGAKPPLTPSFHGVLQKYVEGKLNKILKTSSNYCWLQIQVYTMFIRMNDMCIDRSVCEFSASGERNLCGGRKKLKNQALPCSRKTFGIARTVVI